MSSDPSFLPAYLELLRSGGLDARVEEALDHLAACDLCPRYCRVDRRRSVKGALCHTGAQAVVHSYGPHHGEEHPLRGIHGSGTIFFAWCNLRCAYCQNWEISQKGIGHEASTQALAGMMLELQAMGCHNINLVSPSHVVAQIIAAVAIARPKRGGRNAEDDEPEPESSRPRNRSQVEEPIHVAEPEGLPQAGGNVCRAG